MKEDILCTTLHVEHSEGVFLRNSEAALFYEIFDGSGAVGVSFVLLIEENGL